MVCPGLSEPMAELLGVRDVPDAILTFEPAPVDRKSPLPAWAQVDRDLRLQIDQAGRVGDRLPTERELANAYGVSRITVRQALASLAYDGYLDRVQGAGTFVADRPLPVQHEIALMLHWRDRFIAEGRDASSHHLEQADIKQEPFELTRFLKDSEIDLPRMYLKRLHLVDGRGIGITESWFVAAGCPDLLSQPLLEGSLSKTLETRHGIRPAHTDHYLEVGTASQEDAELLLSTGGAHLVVVWSIARLAEGQLMETSKTTWLPNRLRFHYSTH